MQCSTDGIRELAVQVDYTEEAGKLYTFKYPLAEGGDAHLPVATTRPETILGDTAVAVNPNDERFSRFIGQSCIVPLSGGRWISQERILKMRELTLVLFKHELFTGQAFDLTYFMDAGKFQSLPAKKSIPNLELGA